MRTCLVALLVGVAWIGGARPSAQGQLVFFASFEDEAGEPVTDVLPVEFRVLEDDVEGRILGLEPIDWPVRVSILVDNGHGMDRHLLNIRNGVRGLLEALPAGVESSLLTMAPQPRWVVRPTTDRSALLDGVSLITPDAGGAKFVDALREAGERIARQDGDFFPVVIILGSTGAENPYVSDPALERMLLRYAERAATVHVVMLTAPSPLGSVVTGAFQTQVGATLAEMTGGRFESLAAASRIATLLPEIGEQVALSHVRQSRQYRVTVERPAGREGPLGRLILVTEGGLRARLSRDGHLP
jgi:hypothetical protein